MPRKPKCINCGTRENLRTKRICYKCDSTVRPSTKDPDYKHFRCKPEDMENITKNMEFLKIKMR